MLTVHELNRVPDYLQASSSFQFIVGSGGQETETPSIRMLEPNGEIEHQQAPALTATPDRSKYEVLPGYVAEEPPAPAEVRIRQPSTNFPIGGSMLGEISRIHATHSTPKPSAATSKALTLGAQ